MLSYQDSKWFRNFSRNLVLAGGIYSQRKKAKEDLDNHLERMRKSIIRMTLTYSDLDKLKGKIDKAVGVEREYSRFFRPEDGEVEELKAEIAHLEGELAQEKESKSRIMSEHNEKNQQLMQSLESIKNQLKHLHLEKAKRHHRLKALDHKIKSKIDVHSYYHS